MLLLHACDVYDSIGSTRRVIIDESVTNHVVLSSTLFWKEMRASYASDEDMHRQIARDMPRQETVINGKRLYTYDELVSSDVDVKWYPCLTQAIMFIPMLILHGDGEFVIAECPSKQPLSISVTDDMLVVKKTLRLIPSDRTIHLHLYVMDSDDIVSVHYYIEPPMDQPKVS